MTLTREEAQESKEMNDQQQSLRVHADALLSLSSSPADADKRQTTTPAGRRALAAEGVFECKTCSKRFPSFQALGGHRTSHTRLQARMLLQQEQEQDQHERDAARARVHECAVCGLEFSMGQALGGHMRRHRAAAMASPPTSPPAPETKTFKNHGGVKRGLVWLDLNHPPCGEDSDFGCGSDADGGECGRDMAAAAKLTFHQFLDTGTMAVDCVGY